MSHAGLFIFAGLPGVGKTSLAQLLAKKLPAAYLRIDTIEQGLRDLLNVKVDEEGYRLAYRMAADNLRLGQNVVADSCNPSATSRREWEGVAQACSMPFRNIEVICSDIEEHRSRVENRGTMIPGLKLPTWSDVTVRRYEAWQVGDCRIVVDTAGLTIDDAFEELIAQLSNL